MRHALGHSSRMPIRFVSRLLNRPQLLEPSAAAAVIGALMPGAEMLAYSGSADPVERDARDYQVTSSATAIIPIVGELVHRGAAMDASSGLTSYQALQDMMSDALGDPDITGVLLDVDSPGGEASGVLDFAEWIAARRGAKPIWASVNLAACSAAYAIASAADRIVMAGADAVAGSIGVVAVHTDLSAGLARQGAKLTFVHAGAHKIDGNPAMPLPDAVRDEWQAEVDDLYARFCAVVAANRGIPESAVRGTEARVYRAADAVAAGLADDIASQEDVLMTLTQRRAPSGARISAAAASASRVLMAEPAPAPTPAPKPPAPAPAQPVPVAVPVAVPVQSPQPPPPPPPPAPEEPPPPPAPTEEEQGDMPAEEADTKPRRNTPMSPVPAHPQALAEACTKAGFPELIAPLLADGASMEAVNRRLADARAIKQAAADAGLPGMSAALIRAGMSLADARSVVFAARAGAADAIPIATAHGGATGVSGPRGPITVAEGKAVLSRFNTALRGG